MLICWSGITNSTQPTHHLGTQGRWLSVLAGPQWCFQRTMRTSVPLFPKFKTNRSFITWNSSLQNVCTRSWAWVWVKVLSPSKSMNWGPMHQPFVDRCSPNNGRSPLAATPLSLSWQENNSRTSTFWQIRPNCPSANSGIVYIHDDTNDNLTWFLRWVNPV